MAVTGTPTTGNDVLQSDGAADSIDALAGNDVLIGNGGNDTLNGNTGDDTMIGGLGDDSYVVDSVNDVVSENANEGTDTVNTSVSFTLGANVENLIARGSDNVTLTGNALVNQITGNTGANVIYGGDDSAGAAADTLTGGGGNDTYIIRDGADDVIVELADDAVAGTTGGSDTVQVVASANRTAYTLDAAAVVEVLQASDGSSTLALNLTGNQFAQFIVGNAGTNVLDGGTNPAGTANDTLVGLAGDDTYIVRNSRVTVVEADGAGNDTVDLRATASGSYTFAQSIETIDARMSTAATLNITGGANNQTIYGSAAGANRINGGGGTDALIGGTGNDTFTVDSFDDTVTDGGGTLDRVSAASSYALAAASGIEYFTAAGTTLSTRTGQGDGTFNLNALNTTVTSNFFVGDNATAQFIFGDAGNNILNGRITATLATGETAGQINDTLIGGAGSDTYRVYSQTDRVIEDTSGGTADFIYTSASYNLATNDAAVGAITFSDDGISTADGITPVRTTRTISDYVVGAQQIEVLSAADQAAGTTGVTGMNLTGNAYGQIIVGDFNDNVIDDGGSLIGTTQYQDQLAGLGGNDTYVVRAQNTTVNESIGGGSDTVNVMLAAAGGFFGLIDRSEVEFVTAAGMGNLSVGLSGNEFNQTITGSGGDNTFDGRGGQDTLVGGAGNDTYFITTAQAASITTIIEDTAATGGTADAVSTSVSFDLAATNAAYVPSTGAAAVAAGGIIGIEQIYVTTGSSTNDVNLTGNGAAQFMVGNYGNNVLDGDNDSRVGNVSTGALRGSGTVTAATTNTGDTVVTAGDTLVGLFGNDTYRVYNQADVVRENANEGTDTVLTSDNYQLRAGNSIEVLSVADTASSNNIRLIGNEFNQTLIGNAGNNQLWGGAGNDTLIGGAGSDTYGFARVGTANADLLQDFTPGDFIGLHSDGTAATTFGGLGTTFDQNEFVLGTTATEAHAQVLYNQATGQLFYDSDGTGSAAAQLFATLAAGTGLGFNDFQILATAPTTAAAA